MLIIWLQGIWLPLHGYDYADTPLWAGIFLLPLTAGFLVAGPVSGTLSDRFGARGVRDRRHAAVRRDRSSGCCCCRSTSPTGRSPLLIAANGIGSGMFSAPNTSSIMSSVPAGQRGVASGMRSTFQNSGTALSIGVFFSLMIAGCRPVCPHAMSGGLQQQGVPPAVAARWPALPPVSTLFAAVLGDNPLEHLLAPTGALTCVAAGEPADHHRAGVLSAPHRGTLR